MALTDEELEEIGGWLDDLKAEMLEAVASLRSDIVHEMGLLEQRLDGIQDDIASLP